jgi:NarL family two-component system response regulator LiaR
MLNRKDRRKVHVMIVDDDKDMHLFISDIVSATDNFMYAGGFSESANALAQIPCLRPDLVLMDIRMPGLDGIECTRRLREMLPQLKLVIVTGVRDSSSIDNALQAGADAYLIKPFSVEQLIATLKFAVAQRELTVQRRREKGRTCATCHLGLTQREQQVMKLLARGLLYKEIAQQLEISYSAVHKYQHNIFQKFQVKNRSEAINKWFEIGCVD